MIAIMDMDSRFAVICFLVRSISFEMEDFVLFSLSDTKSYKKITAKSEHKKNKGKNKTKNTN